MTLRSREIRFLEQAPRKQERLGKRGVEIPADRQHRKSIGEAAEARRGVEQRPGHHNVLRPGVGPLDIGNRNPAKGARSHRLQQRSERSAST